MSEESLPMKRKLLTEEEYFDQVSEIVQHNYFPNLKKYRSLNKYLEALESDNTKQAAKVASEFAKPKKKVPTLKEFYSQYTSEDNASFERLQERNMSKLVFYPKQLTYEAPPPVEGINRANTSTSLNLNDVPRTGFFVIFMQINRLPRSESIARNVSESIKYKKRISYFKAPSKASSIFSKSPSQSYASSHLNK